MNPLQLSWCQGTHSLVKAIAPSAFLLLVTPSFVVHAEPRTPHPPWPEHSLSIFGWDEGYWFVPQRQRAIGAEQAVMQESWSGFALSRGIGEATPVAIPALDLFGKPGVAPDAGAVRFWYNANWSSVGEVERKGEAVGKGPGQPARLLELVNLGGQFPDIRWSLHANAEGNQLRLAGIELGRVKEMLTVPLYLRAGEWRLITLCYSPEGTQLWLDGELAATGAGIKAGIAGWEDRLGLIVGSAYNGLEAANGQFEEVALFDYWPTAEQQRFYFQGVSRQVRLGPVGTPEEEILKQDLVWALDGPPAPGEGGGGGGGGGTNPPAYNYAPGTFYVEILGATNSQAQLRLHNTLPDVMYELLSAPELTNGFAWTGETPFVLGAVGATSTVASVPWLDRTNSLFLQARSWADTDGDGLPDWWEEAYGLDPNLSDTSSLGISDGYKDGDGDGWTNLEELRNGTDPSGFNTPPVPRGVMAAYGVTTTNVTVSWNTALGNVTGYSVRRLWDGLWQTSQVSSASTTLSDTIPAPIFFEPFDSPNYYVRVNYASGSSEWSRPVSPGERVGGMLASIVRGSQGKLRLVVSALPESAVSLRLWRVRHAPSYALTNFTVSVNSLVDGQYELPAAWIPDWSTELDHYEWWVQTEDAAGKVGLAISAGEGRQIPFFDGREQLRQNLAFHLRVANAERPLKFDRDWSLYRGRQWNDYAWNSTNYAFASFNDSYGEVLPYAGITEWQPFDDNYAYRNLAFDAGNLNGDGKLNTGVAGFLDQLEMTFPTDYLFQPPTSVTAIAPVLSAAVSQWTYYEPLEWDEGSSLIGLSNIGTNWVMASNAKNLFGLSYLSAKLASSSGVQTLVAGGTYPFTGGYLYPETPQPQLQTIGYYFGQMNAHFLPGHVDFAVTNSTPLLITSIGNPDFTLAGYAKQAIQNGYTNKFAYLGQYFEKAQKQGTTNATGILSPYGEFLPTEPGPVELVTMADLSTGQRGTGVVQVIKLQLDVNHDGLMDLSWSGPDNANTADRPFGFWINSDYDGISNGNEIDASRFQDFTDGKISSQRDLEDFARLWLAGIPALASGAGYTVNLEMWPYTGDPRIKLYSAVETSGGIGYLTNTTTAALQMSLPSPGLALGEVAYGSPLTLPANIFTQAGSKYFLFECSGAGVGQLSLKIYRNEELIASHTQWIELRDIQEMYEQVLAYNVTAGLPPSSLISDVHVWRPHAPTADETKQVIVFVHGINNTEFDYRRSTETLFKRLYWSGYRGKVAGFRWPCAYLPFENTYNPYNYNKGEFYAFKSGNALKNYLTHLSTLPELDGYTINVLAHSQGNIVASEALLQGAPFDNYILSQGAVPANSYDGNSPTLQKLLDADSSASTPNLAGHGGYRQIFATINGNLINFQNTNDYALVSGTWLGAQANWIRNQESQKPESFLSGLGYSFNSQNSLSYRTITVTQVITDEHEIRSMVARSRTAPVGGQPGLGGAIDSSVDLLTTFGFGSTRAEHSAQFTRGIQQNMRPFHRQILQSFEIPVPVE